MFISRHDMTCMKWNGSEHESKVTVISSEQHEKDKGRKKKKQKKTKRLAIASPRQEETKLSSYLDRETLSLFRFMPNEQQYNRVTTMAAIDKTVTQSLLCQRGKKEKESEARKLYPHTLYFVAPLPL